MVAAFGTAQGTSHSLPSLRPVIEDLAHPTLEPIDTSADVFVREEAIQRGDTVAALLTRLGTNSEETLALLHREPKADSIFRQMSPGKRVTARVDRDGALLSLVFPLNGSNDQALILERAAPTDEFSVASQSLPLESHVFMRSAQINYSLFSAADEAGIPDSIASQLADIFGGEIDFHRDIRKGDRFSVIFEAQTQSGRLARTGRILAAEFVNDGHTYRAVWFEGADGHSGYYTEDGKNIRKTFLRSPLEFSRITSGFSTARYHPVLKEVRAHKGIDFGAPTGTKVKATGDGIVEFSGRKGGYGNVVILRHQSQYQTVYGHLSRFAQGLRRGSRVSQGDIIGYVGMTGIATGPHLHYEFRVNGVHRNPLAMALPSAPPLSSGHLAQFRERTQDVLARLDDIRDINLALLD